LPTSIKDLISVVVGDVIFGLNSSDRTEIARRIFIAIKIFFKLRNIINY
tara:strand:- start:625 stop:771 length:147 start_codon:yes stop_codon:yes gene_type:complete